MSDVRAGRRLLCRGRLLLTVAVAGTLALLMGACATIPTSGPVQSAAAPPPGGGDGTNCCGLVVSPWRSGLTATQVVSDFLLASASFAHDHKIARGYLTPQASKLWQPGSQVTILAQTPNVVELPRRLVGAGSSTTSVEVTGQEIATLDPNGQYIPVGNDGAAPHQQVFTLGTSGGRLLITGLPPGQGQVSHELLLTSGLFHLVYAPYNLYFHGLGSDVLVPDPVFVPADSANPDVALVRDLLHNPQGWLNGAADTAFPPDAQLQKIQILPGPPAGRTAIVDLTVPGGTSQSGLQAMAEQLVWTLTSTSFSPALAEAVEFKVNGHLWSPPGSAGPVLTTAEFAQHVPRFGSDAALYFVRPHGAVAVLAPQAAHGAPVPGQAGSGHVPLSQIAVSPDGRYLAGIGDQGSTVYTSDLTAAHPAGSAGDLTARLTGSGFAAPSWDSSGNLWVAGKVNGSPGVWVVPGGGGQPQRVNLPVGLGPVTGLRVAPDGVRIALLVGTSAAAHILLGAIIHNASGYSVLRTVPLGPGLTGITALTWYTSDQVLAISTAISGARLWNVPVNGDRATAVSGPADMVSIAAYGAHNPLYLSLSSGQLEKSVGLGEPWTDSGEGSAATYPG